MAQAGYADLLRQVPAFRRFWVGRGTSSLGDAAQFVALVWIASTSDSPGLAVGAIAFALTAPSVLVTPFAGALSDRLSRRTIMLTADGGRVATACLVPVSYHTVGLEGVFVVTLAHSTLSAGFTNASSAALPSVAGEARLMTATALTLTTEHVALILGSLLGGVLVAESRLTYVFLFNALTFLASALLLMAIPATSFGSAGRTLTGSYWASVRDGFAYTRSQQAVSLLIAIGVLATLGFAPAIVALVVLANEELGVGSFGYATLQALIVIGLAVGAALAARLPTERRKTDLMILGYLGMGAATVALGLASTFWFAAAVVALRGGFNSLLSVPSRTLLQQLVPDEYRGRVFAVTTTLQEIPRLLIVPLAGVLIELVGVRSVYLAMGLIIVVTAGFIAAVRQWIEPKPVVEIVRSRVTTVGPD